MIGAQRVSSRSRAAQAIGSGAASASDGSGTPGVSGGASAGASPAPGAGGPGAAAAKPSPGPGASRSDGKAVGSGQVPSAKASTGKSPRPAAGRSDAKSLDRRKAHTAATSRAQQSQRIPPPPSAATVQSPASGDAHGSATELLEAFFERERGSLPPATVDAIEHYFSYGEWGLAQSMIAGIIENRAATTSEGIDPRLLAAATLVRNDFD